MREEGFIEYWFNPTTTLTLLDPHCWWWGCNALNGAVPNRFSGQITGTKVGNRNVQLGIQDYF